MLSVTELFDYVERCGGDVTTLVEILVEAQGVTYVYDLSTRALVYTSHGLGGYSLADVAEVKGTILTDLVHPDDIPRVEALLAELSEEGEGAKRTLEFRFRGKDGGWRSVINHHTVLLANEDGKGRLLVGLVHDVSEQRQLEEERRVLDRRLKQSWRMEVLGQLAGRMAHDFNNLMTVIQSSVTLARYARPGDAELEREFATIETAIEKTTELTGRLSQLNHKASGLAQLVDANALIKELLASVRRTLASGVTLAVALDPECQAIYASPEHIELAVLSLLFLSCDMMPDGGELRLETKWRVIGEDDAQAPAGRYTVVTVSHTGRALDPSLFSLLDDPFSHNVGPVGLELAAVHRSVKRSGGVFTWQPEGNLLQIFYPAVEPMEALELPPKQARPPKAEGVEGFGDCDILLVEDNPSVRRLLGRTIENMGCRVHAASNGQEGVELADAVGIEALDAIVTDVVMPEMDGPTMLQALWRQRPDLPAVVVSGYTDGRTDIGLNGPHLFVQKPFKPAILCQQLSLLIHERDPHDSSS
ncbi:MAG: hypothetical protein CMH57_06250 [Myxococcales bacterium]|nr:hypothetical protein [Myxococcales bacterium]